MARNVSKLFEVTGDNTINVIPLSDIAIDWFISVGSAAGTGTITVQYRLQEGAVWLDAGTDSVIDLTAEHGITITGPISGFKFTSSNGTDTYSVTVVQ